jgi:lactoylglutathione lyase
MAPVRRGTADPVPAGRIACDGRDDRSLRTADGGSGNRSGSLGVVHDVAGPETTAPRTQETSMTETPARNRILQMRLIVRAHDYEEAVTFYRDVLGAGQELQVHSPDGEQVTILDVGRATLEISNPPQVELIDRVEVGSSVSPHLRVAFEVVDAEQTTAALVEAGATLIAPPTRTPWHSLNSRLHAPGDIQVTVFQELYHSPEPGTGQEAGA